MPAAMSQAQTKVFCVTTGACTVLCLLSVPIITIVPQHCQVNLDELLYFCVSDPVNLLTTSIAQLWCCTGAQDGCAARFFRARFRKAGSV